MALKASRCISDVMFVSRQHQSFFTKVTFQALYSAASAFSCLATVQQKEWDHASDGGGGVVVSDGGAMAVKSERHQKYQLKRYAGHGCGWRTRRSRGRGGLQPVRTRGFLDILGTSWDRAQCRFQVEVQVLQASATSVASRLAVSKVRVVRSRRGCRQQFMHSHTTAVSVRSTDILGFFSVRVCEETETKWYADMLTAHVAPCPRAPTGREEYAGRTNFFGSGTMLPSASRSLSGQQSSMLSESKPAATIPDVFSARATCVHTRSKHVRELAEAKIEQKLGRPMLEVHPTH